VKFSKHNDERLLSFIKETFFNRLSGGGLRSLRKPVYCGIFYSYHKAPLKCQREIFTVVNIIIKSGAQNIAINTSHAREACFYL